MKIARAFSARATSWPMIKPPMAGDATTSIRWRIQFLKRPRETGAQIFGVLRMLEHSCALHVFRAVKAAGEPEMSMQVRPVCSNNARISFTIHDSMRNTSGIFLSP